MALKEKHVVPKWEVDVSDDGRIAVRNKAGWERYKDTFRGKPAHLILKKITKFRSRQEEKFYHGVVVRMVAEEMGVSAEEAHEFLKGLFLRVEERTPGGVRYERVMSTTELGDKAYREYWENLIRWAAMPTKDDGLSQDSGLGLYIPMPNESDWENL